MAMGRYAFLLLLLAACPKKEKEAELEPLGSDQAPPAGRSVTKVEEDGSTGGSGLKGKLQAMAEDKDGSGALSKPASNKDRPPAPAPDAAVTPPAAGSTTTVTKAGEKKKFGGDGSPPYYDDEGHIHGPGGPVFMGRGPECNAERDHCMRPGVWFAVDNLVSGKMYRATPIFEHEKKWYTWRGKEAEFQYRLKTKLATKDTLKVGDPVVWFIDENSSKKWVDNEYDALTSSRWTSGFVQEWVGSDRVRVAGWTYGLVPLDTIRVIVERK
jgi:hypothetical protein